MRKVFARKSTPKETPDTSFRVSATQPTSEDAEQAATSPSDESDKSIASLSPKVEDDTTPPPISDPKPKTIAQLGFECQRQIEVLYAKLESDNAQAELSMAVGDELGRFRLWASNIGALNTGRASLDYRVRDAEYLDQNIKSLLQDLKESLIEGSSTLFRKFI